jgi:outer membrane protein OmpA-like peptidoglycan-associated protein
MKLDLQRSSGRLAWAAMVVLAGCAGPSDSVVSPPAPAPAPVAAAAPARAAAPAPAPAAAPTPARAPAAATPAAPPTVTAAPASANNVFVAPAPVRFEDSIARAGQSLYVQAAPMVGNEPRVLVIDPLIDANTGAQTVSTVKMGEQLESIAKSRNAKWSVKPLTRDSLAQKPLLLIGTLTPVTVERSIDTVPDAFRVWLTLIDLRTGKVVAKQIDRATVDSVNPEPLKYYQDSPTWHKDKTVLGYINSCQINTKIGDPADPDYLAHLPAAAVVNEAILAYDDGKVPLANKLYKEAEPIADPGDLRVLNGLYITSWQLGQHDAARDAFGKLVESGLELKRLPVKLLFQPGKTQFNAIGDLPQQYTMWIASLAQKADKTDACVRVVGHTSRTGSVRGNEILSRQRAEAVRRMLERDNRALAAKLSATGVGSREALVGLGTDDVRDALDRRVEFRVVDCV